METFKHYWMSEWAGPREIYIFMPQTFTGWLSLSEL